MAPPSNEGIFVAHPSNRGICIFVAHPSNEGIIMAPPLSEGIIIVHPLNEGIHPTMSRMRIYEEEDDMSDSNYKEEDYDEEEDEDDTRAEHVSAKRGTSQGKKDTSKMKGNMQDMIDLSEYREREIKKLKLEIT